MDLLYTHEVTRDTLWQGRLVFWQPARGKGYRFNLDPVLLADFVSPGEQCLDLGCGVLVVGMLLLASHKVSYVTGVEVQPSLAALAEQNVVENAMDQKAKVLLGDCRHLSLPLVDRVVFNPPYFPSQTGRAAPQEGRDAARHERYGTLADFVGCAVKHLKPEGCLAAIVPSGRTQELFRLLFSAGFDRARRRWVVPRQGEAPGHALIEARFIHQPKADTLPLIDEEAPLIVHQGAGREYSSEVNRMLAGV